MAIAAAGGRSKPACIGRRAWRASTVERGAGRFPREDGAASHRDSSSAVQKQNVHRMTRYRLHSTRIQMLNGMREIPQMHI